MNHAITNNPSKLNILIITLAPPLPADAGGTIYMANTLVPLSTEYNFHLVSVGAEAEKQLVIKHQDTYNKHFKSIFIQPRNNPLTDGTSNKFSKLCYLLQHLYYKLPFIDVSYFSLGFIKNIKAIVKEKKIDLLEIHSTHLAFIKRFIPEIPALLVSHNIESDIFPFWVRPHYSGITKKIIEFIASKSRYYAKQVEIFNKWNFEAMTFISEQDMHRVSNCNLKRYLPLCLPVKLRNTRTPDGKVNCLWMGAFWWFPNMEAILWFIKEILPPIKQKLVEENIALHFLGKAPPQELLDLHDDNHIFVYGYVESIDEIIDKADLLFVPLRTGGGIRVKILEAMSCGIPVLSTSKGCEGLLVHDNQDIFIEDDPAIFGQKLIQLAMDRQLQNNLAFSAIQLLNEHYSQDKALNVKRYIYSKLASRS